MLNLHLPLGHRRYTANVDAFVDGELRGSEVARFRAHLAGCDSCTDAVARARTLKATLSAAREMPVRRSFQLTPEMVTEASGVPERAPVSRTPLYLVAARAAAGIAVVAFGTAFAISLAGDSESHSQSSAGSAAGERNSAPVAADAAASTSLPAETPAQTFAVSPTSLAVPSSGGVSGASAASATPEAPSSGAAGNSGPGVTDDSSTKSSAGPPATALGDAVAVADLPQARSDEDKGFPWTIAFGCLAGALVGIVLTLEYTRRRR